MNEPLSLLLPELAAAAANSNASATLQFAEKLSRHLDSGESVIAQLRLRDKRELVYAFPLLQWLKSDKRKGSALIALPAEQALGRILGLISPIAERVSLSTAVCGAAEPEIAADIVFGTPESLCAAHERGALQLRDFGLVALDGADRLSEAEYVEDARKLKGFCFPPGKG